MRLRSLTLWPRERKAGLLVRVGSLEKFQATLVAGDGLISWRDVVERTGPTFTALATLESSEKKIRTIIMPLIPTTYFIRSNARWH